MHAGIERASPLLQVLTGTYVCTCVKCLHRLEALLDEKLSLVERLGNGNKGFAAAQLRTDAYRQVCARNIVAVPWQHAARVHTHAHRHTPACQRVWMARILKCVKHARPAPNPFPKQSWKEGSCLRGGRLHLMAVVRAHAKGYIYQFAVKPPPPTPPTNTCTLPTLCQRCRRCLTRFCTASRPIGPCCCASSRSMTLRSMMRWHRCTTTCT